jgi:hypothetical protein
MATRTSTTARPPRRGATVRRLAVAEHWLLALVAHVMATTILVVLSHALRLPSCG